MTNMRKRVANALIVCGLLFVVYQGYVLTAARHAAAQTQLHLDFLINNAPVAIIACDAEGRIQVFNAAASEMFGYAHAELRGKPVDELLPEPLRAGHQELVDSAAAKLRDKPEDWELVNSCISSNARKKDGTLFPVLVTVRGIVVSGKVEFIGFIQHAPPSNAPQSWEGPLPRAAK